MTLLFINDDPEDTELFCEAVTYLNNSQFIYEDKEPVTCVTAIMVAWPLTCSLLERKCPIIFF